MQRDLLVGEVNAEVERDIRRLVDALELYVLSNDENDPHRSACAFVAAEALELRTASVEQTNAQNDQRYGLAPLEIGLLFQIAGFDANAAAAVAEFEADAVEVHSGAIRAIERLLKQSPPAAWAAAEGDANQEDVADDRYERIDRALWSRVASAAESHQRWLHSVDGDEESPGVAVLQRIETLLRANPEAASRYAAAGHISSLLLAACRSTASRALRRVAGTDAMGDYVSATVERRPLLWPAAEIFARECLESLDRHAAVAVPTGAGKSAVAELAVVRGLSEGWCLYLAPTNALVAQIRRDLRAAVEGSNGRLRSFVGGGEFTTEEVIEEVVTGDVLVMTPEKCALALRQSPEAFSTLRLMVLDECHLLGVPGTRGVVAELVTAEILARSTMVTVVLMSALVSNAAEIAEWLRDASGKGAVPIDEPWRPTRTMRGLVGLNRSAYTTAEQSARDWLQARPTRVSRHDVPLTAMLALQGAWTTDNASDYAVVGLPGKVEVQFRARRPHEDVAGWRNRAAETLSIALGQAGEHVLTFIPANKHEVVVVARTVAQGITAATLSQEVLDHIGLAEFELGQTSEIGDLLKQGVATHSAALIDDERRASELAFGSRFPSVGVMIATTSLAQGLNLPATVVVIAGTRIGDTQSEGARAARDLLNAIGRAGRPFVANRSLALVIPNTPARLGTDSPPAAALQRARFIRFDDAAAPLESQLVPLLRRDAERLASLDAMTEEELAAFTYLPLRDGTDFAKEIVARTLGQHQRALEVGPDLGETIEALGSLGTRFLASGEAPSWLVEVAYLSSRDLRAIAALYRVVVANPAQPTTVVEWSDALIRWIQLLPRTAQELFCDLQDVPEPLHRGLRRNDPEAWEHLRLAARRYLLGDSLTDLAEVAFGLTRDDGRRSSTDPLPKAVSLVRDLLSYRLSMAAGALQALFGVAVAQDEETELRLNSESESALASLPLAMRLGCHDRSSRLWSRYGVGRRRLAHVLARVRPIPDDRQTEREIRSWTRAALRDIADDTDLIAELDEAEQIAVITASTRLA
jgi:hypothetical protein